MMYDIRWAPLLLTISARGPVCMYLYICWWVFRRTVRVPSTYAHSNHVSYRRRSAWWKVPAGWSDLPLENTSYLVGPPNAHIELSVGGCANPCEDIRSRLRQSFENPGTGAWPCPAKVQARLTCCCCGPTISTITYDTHDTHDTHDTRDTYNPQDPSPRCSFSRGPCCLPEMTIVAPHPTLTCCSGTRPS